MNTEFEIEEVEITVPSVTISDENHCINAGREEGLYLPITEDEEGWDGVLLLYHKEIDKTQLLGALKRLASYVESK